MKKRKKKKKSVRSGNRTHTHICGLEHSLASKQGHPLVPPSRPLHSITRRLAAHKLPHLREERCGQAPRDGLIWAARPHVVEWSVGGRSGCTLESSALTIWLSWQATRMVHKYVHIHNALLITIVLCYMNTCYYNTKSKMASIGSNRT